MSSDEADQIATRYEEKDAQKHRRNFIARMEHKLSRKERFSRGI